MGKEKIKKEKKNTIPVVEGVSNEVVRYLLIKKQEMEREFGKTFTHKDFMILFVRSQPDFEVLSKK